MGDSIFSKEAEVRAEHKVKLDREREQRGLALGDTKARVKKYDRLKKKNKIKGVEDKKLRRFLKTSDSAAQHAARKAARSELLLQEEPGFLEAEGLEKTSRFKQEDIAAAVPLASSQQYFDLKLDTFGPYNFNYSHSGRSLLIGGRKGHLATFRWREKELGCEFHVYQTVRDVQFLHNDMMFAAAQKRFVYLYDHTGMELHCLKQLREVHRLTFLPYHFLLVAADDHGGLHYLDTSMGRSVISHRTQLGPLHCMAQNPHNAIIHLGHNNGTVTLWSPNVHSPLVKVLCHSGPLTDLAVEHGGWTMVTVGMDARMKIWDIRSTYQELYNYRTLRPAASVAVSQRGMVGLGKGRVVEVWRDLVSKGAEKQKAPYLTHRVGGDVNKVEFCPFEDCLGIGHEKGFASIIVPGCGEPNFDALEANPFQTKKQRQEEEVKKLLEKIPSELITLDPTQITKVHQSKEGDKEEEEGRKGMSVGRVKRKTRGKDALVKKVHRKQELKEEREREARRQQLQEAEAVKKEEDKDSSKKRTPQHKHVLDRFR